MRRTVPDVLRITLAVAAFLVTVPPVSRAAGTATGARPGSAAPAAKPIQLVESVPVETALGNPALPQAKDVWVEMLRGARRTIDVEGFYFSTWPGEPLEPVIAALGAAAQRGVRVRLLFDQGMSKTYPKPLDSLATVKGITVRKIDMRRIAGGVQHAKYFLVDGEQTFVGSQNFDWRALQHIHELGVRVRDARVARAFGEVFEWDWNAADTTAWTMRMPPATGREMAQVLRKLPAPPEPHKLDAPLRIVQAPGDTAIVWLSYSPKGWIPDPARWDLDAVTGAIDRARSEIVLQLLTYAPEEYGEKDETIDQALRRAAGRGVKVKLLIADWVVNGKGIDWLKRLAQVPNVEVKLSTIPDWSGGYVPFARVEHCKYMVADTSTTWIGTANWGPGYFYGSRNLAFTFENRPIAADARRVFETSWTAASANPVRVDFAYPEKIRGATPPPGKTVYGN